MGWWENTTHVVEGVRHAVCKVILLLLLGFCVSSSFQQQHKQGKGKPSTHTITVFDVDQIKKLLVSVIQFQLAPNSEIWIKESVWWRAT